MIIKKICKCINTILAFTQNYSRVLYPPENMSILSKVEIRPKAPQYIEVSSKEDLYNVELSYLLTSRYRLLPG